MSCPLIGHIAIHPEPGLAEQLAGPAVRVSGYHGHDVILVNPEYSLWDRAQAVSECVRSFERQLLVFGVRCSCEPLSLTA